MGNEMDWFKAYELRILKNYIDNMPKVYRKRHVNFVIVQDILLWGTSTAGKTSCVNKCIELGIDPYGYDLTEVKK